MHKLEKLKSMIKESSNIVFFGGAGVSTESDIPDFRSESGLYKTKNNYSYPPEIILSHSFYNKHPEEFFEFYKNKMVYTNAKPNLAHKALVNLENEGKLSAIITQNIDGLHQIAGSKKVIELHGSIHRNYCTKCNKFFDLNYVLSSNDDIPLCDECKGVIKPDVVLYEEPLNMESIEETIKYIRNADMLIVGGTSLVVYPAAGLVDYYNGDKLVLINKSSTPYDYKANLVINDSIGKTLNDIL